MTTLTIGLDHTADVCPHRHTHSCTACVLPSLQDWLLSWIYRSGRRGEARTGGPTSPPLPRAPTLAHPLTCSFILAHAVGLLARPWLAFGRRECLV